MGVHSAIDTEYEWEWHNFKSFNPEIKVLLTLDEASYKGGENGENSPIAWCHEYDGGKVLYTAGRHTKESYSVPDFLKHLLGGISTVSIISTFCLFDFVSYV